MICAVLIVGLTVVGHLDTTADTFNIGTTPTANAINSTMSTTLFSNVYGAYNLSFLIPFIAGIAALVAFIIYSVNKTLPNEKETNNEKANC